MVVNFQIVENWNNIYNFNYAEMLLMLQTV
jgi:hypothetical protein